MEQLQDPIAVINTMQARIDQLERQLQMEREAAQGREGQLVADAVRRFRFHGVIPLLVAEGGIEKLEADVARHSPILMKAVHEVWPVETRALQAATIADIMATAKNGMSRWV